VTFRITFTNPGTLSATVPPHGLLVATDDTGRSFLLWPKPINLEIVPVSPGGSVVVELRPRGSFNDGTYFVGEPRLHRPGEFRFHLVAGKFWHQEDGGFDISESGIRSSEVTLHVIEPVGIDLDVWRELSKNRPDESVRVWFPSSAGWALSARIVRQFPDSQYASWMPRRACLRNPMRTPRRFGNGWAV
jgi:hypothetical protein